MENEVAMIPEMPPMPLVALTPTEMVAAQNSLGEWCDKKLDQMRAELKDALANVKLAKTRKWKSSSFESLATRLRGKINFYEKVKGAVDNGYLVIPNFPIDAFAVRRRTNEGHAPDGPAASHGPWNVPALTAQAALPAGTGEYANPDPTTYKQVVGTDDEGKNIERWFAHSYQDMEFPVALAKPHVIDATQKAMALRIFDRIGLVGPEKKKDPIVVGQIFRKEGWGEQCLTFFIAWWFNWEML